MTTQEIIFEDISQEASPLLDLLELVWTESNSIQNLVSTNNGGRKRQCDHFSWLFSCRPCEDSSGTDIYESSTKNKETRRKKGSKEDQLLQWLRKFPISPINNIFKTNQFFNSPYIFWNLKKFRNNQILKIFNKTFLNITTDETGN